MVYNANEPKQKIEELLAKHPDYKKGADNATEADIFNCYSWDDHSHVIKEHCWLQVDFYNVLSTGDSQKISKFIDGVVEGYLKKL